MPVIIYQNLREHWQRMKDMYWGDWEEKLYKDPGKPEQKKEKTDDDKANGTGEAKKDDEKKEEEKKDDEEEDNK